MLFAIVVLVAAVVVGVVVLRRSGRGDPRSARRLAFAPAVLGVVLGVALAAHVAREAAGPTHSIADLTWAIWVTVAAAAGGALLLAGTVLWHGRPAWWLRLVGFVGLLLATIGSLSWVLPLFTPLALLAAPSLVVREPREEREDPARTTA